MLTPDVSPEPKPCPYLQPLNLTLGNNLCLNPKR